MMKLKMMMEVVASLVDYCMVGIWHGGCLAGWLAGVKMIVICLLGLFPLLLLLVSVSRIWLAIVFQSLGI